MDQSRWLQINWLFQEAIELRGAARREYLRRSATDTSIVADVERLLDLHDSAGDFLESSTSDIDSSFREESAPCFEPGDIIDRFRLLRRCDMSGMGEVWLAERADKLFEQFVALKIMRKNALAMAHAFQKFHAERQTLARLEHPFITRLIDGGTTDDGRAYLVMEWVNGIRIDRYCRCQLLDQPAIIRLFFEVCDAVQFAHQHLVIHRDIKPANILISEDGRPKLLDFGIAELVEPGWPDLAESRRGLTPDFASPEQLRGGQCTTASDVYSLGLLLQRLIDRESTVSDEGIITKYTAAVGNNNLEPKQHALAARFGDLGLIIAKATRTEPNDRYQTVRDLSDDIRRYVNGYPITARSATRLYRIERFIRRNPKSSIFTAISSAMLLLSTIAAINGVQHTRKERDSAVASSVFLDDILSSASPFQLGRNPTVQELLKKTSMQASNSLRTRPEVELRVRMTLIRAYVSMWNWKEVLSESTRALELASKVFGPESSEAGDCLTLLGRAQTWLRQERATATQQQALSTRKRLYGDSHPAVAETLVNLGFATWWTASPSDHEGAKKLYEQGLSIFRQTGSTHSADYARALFSYANLLEELGGYRIAALQAAGESVSCFESLEQPPDRYSTAALLLYGTLLINEGQLTTGVPYLRTFVKQVPVELSDAVPLHIAYWRIAFAEVLMENRPSAFEAFRACIEFECRWQASNGGEPEVWNSFVKEVHEVSSVTELLVVVKRIATSIAPTAQYVDMNLLERLQSVAVLATSTNDHLTSAKLNTAILDLAKTLFPRSQAIPDNSRVLLAHDNISEGNLEAAKEVLESAFSDLRARRGLYHPFCQFALVDLIHLAEAREDFVETASLRAMLTKIDGQ